MKQVWGEYQEWERWLEALLYAGGAPCFLPARRLPTAGIPASVKVIFAPSLVVLRDGVAEVLARWVEAGGRLVAGPFTGVYRMDGWTHQPSPGGVLQDLFGLRVRDRISGDRFDLVAAPKSGTVLSGAHLLELVESTAGTAVRLRSGKNPAVLTRRCGRGTATYLATFVGPANQGYRSRLSQWIGAFMKETSGAAAGAKIDGPVWWTTSRKDDQEIFFVQNPDQKKKARAVFELKSPVLLKDVVSGEIFKGKKSVRVPFAARQVRMLAHSLER